MSFRLVGIGEVLWDLLPAGAQLGGAPANFAYHAHALGATACVVTRHAARNGALETESGSVAATKDPQHDDN